MTYLCFSVLLNIEYYTFAIHYHLFTLPSTHIPPSLHFCQSHYYKFIPLMNLIFPTIVRQLPLGSCFIMCYLFKAGLALKPNEAAKVSKRKPMASHKNMHRFSSTCYRTQKTKRYIFYLCG